MDLDPEAYIVEQEMKYNISLGVQVSSKIDKVVMILIPSTAENRHLLAFSLALSNPSRELREIQI